MAELTAPYNFVPLSELVFFPDWADDVSMDKPFEDGEDGIIELTLINQTPFFTRNGGTRDEKSEYSSSIDNKDGTRTYFIPGTTIKGCIRSVMECLSFAKLGPYNKSYFGMVRDFNTRNSDNEIFIDAMRRVRCGWLKKVDKEYYLTPCSKGIQKIRHKNLKEMYQTFNIGEDHKTAQIKQESLSPNELYPVINVEREQYSYTERGNEKYVPEGEYTIVCTGFMAGKVHEYLFSTELGEAISVSSDVFNQFDCVHCNTEYYALHGNPGFLKKRLMSGLPIPVFYILEDGKVKSMGITRMYRLPYENGVEKAVNNCYNKDVDLKKKDLVETIFGYVGDSSVRGRVSFSHAFCQEAISDEVLIPKTGVLGQPSASYYPLYLEQSTAPYKTYSNSDLKIAGRKRYRIIEGNKTNPLPLGNGNEKVGCTFKALPVGKVFRCKVAVHNLRKAEIGALLSSMTMHNTNGVFLNMGSAKSFGFGKMSVSVRLGQGFKYSIEDYLREFEIALARKNFKLMDTSIEEMVSIASEHQCGEMRMMEDPKSYGENKENTNFSKLSERHGEINHYLTLEDVESIYNEQIKERKEREAKEKDVVTMQGEYEKKVSQLKDELKAADNNKKSIAIEFYKKSIETIKAISSIQSRIEFLLKEIVQLGGSASYEFCIIPSEADIQQKVDDIKKQIETEQVGPLSDYLLDFKGNGVGKLFEYIARGVKNGKMVTEADVNIIAQKCLDQIAKNCKNQKDRERWKDVSKWKELAKALGSEELKDTIFGIVISEL